jgi:hypothetical protein
MFPFISETKHVVSLFATPHYNLILVVDKKKKKYPYLTLYIDNKKTYLISTKPYVLFLKHFHRITKEKMNSPHKGDPKKILEK